MSLLSLASNITPLANLKLIALGVLAGGILALALVFGWKYHKLLSEVKSLAADNATLTTNNKILQENNKVIKANTEVLIAANTTTASTAASLMDERKFAQIAISTLAASTVSDKAVITKLNQKLKDLIKDPSNDGPVSPALRETVRQVQNTRSDK